MTRTMICRERTGFCRCSPDLHQACQACHAEEVWPEGSHQIQCKEKWLYPVFSGLILAVTLPATPALAP